MTRLDAALVLGYLVVAFGVGLWATRSAGRGLSSYFVADRSLPWWWLGTSMAATTFASDTPLVVTGFVADHGISGNWFLWAPAVGLVLLAVVFARNWRSSHVITDAELTELRYAGRPAAALRGFKAFFGSVFVNCIVLGWVFAAMAKITRPFVSWQAILGEPMHTALHAAWPSWLLFDSFESTLSIFTLFLVVVAYSTAGGIRGVVFTDLIQFGIAMVASILFAWHAVDHVGGLHRLWSRLQASYPDGQPGLSSSDIVALWPAVDAGGAADAAAHGAAMSFGAFLAGIGVLWWANSQVDGSGYLAQRINTAREPRDAEWGALWFCFANFVLRSWPWVLVGLVALVVFPLDNPLANTPLGAELGGDREMAYPVLMKLVLPPGLLGLTLVSLVAAFMSTVDTHINWGASYLANDLYKRFLRPRASEREFVLVSRLSVVLLSAAAVLVATRVDQVGDMWKFYFAMMAGLGVPHILRWLWWRANAWTEIAGMGSGILLAVPAYSLGWADGVPAEYVVAMIAGVSACVAITTTLLTPAEPEPVLLGFARQVQPVGVWRGLSPASSRQFRLRLLAWAAGVLGLFGLLLGTGWALRFEWGSAASALALGAVASWATWSLLRQAARA